VKKLGNQSVVIITTRPTTTTNDDDDDDDGKAGFPLFLENLLTQRSPGIQRQPEKDCLIWKICFVLFEVADFRIIQLLLFLGRSSVCFSVFMSISCFEYQ